MEPKKLEISKYRIMCPSDPRLWDKMFREKEVLYYRALCEKIKEFFTEIGSCIQIVDYEPTTPDDRVIIVGPTCGLAVPCLMRGVHTYEYVIRTSGNRILLCSDGLSNVVTNEEMLLVSANNSDPDKHPETPTVNVDWQ